MSWFVYLIQAGANGPVKIGSARDPRRRLLTLQTGCFAPLELIGLENMGSRESAMLMEKALHRKFVDYRLLGEWFSFVGDLRKGIDLFQHGDRFHELLNDFELGRALQ